VRGKVRFRCEGGNVGEERVDTGGGVMVLAIVGCSKGNEGCEEEERREMHFD